LHRQDSPENQEEFSAKNRQGSAIERAADGPREEMGIEKKRPFEVIAEGSRLRVITGLSARVEKPMDIQGGPAERDDDRSPSPT